MNPTQLAIQALKNFGGQIFGATPMGQLGSDISGAYGNAVKPFQDVINKYNAGIQSPIPSYNVLNSQNPGLMAYAQQNSDANDQQQRVLAAKVSPTPQPNPVQQGVSTVEKLAAKVVNSMNSVNPFAAPAQQAGNQFSDFTTASVPDKFSSLIFNSAKQYGIDPNVFASILFREHGFSETPGIDRNANGTYDRGIAQLNTGTVPVPPSGADPALDPNFAIPKAASILASYISRSKDLAHGIAAYNVGVGGAQDDATFNTRGMHYLNLVKAGLTPQLIKKLGL